MKFLLWLASLLLVFQIFQNFAPGKTWSEEITSDSMIPVLMSKETLQLPRDFYYWGQERFGTFPFFLQNFLSTNLGFPATIQTLFLLAIFCFAIVFSLNSLFSQYAFFFLIPFFMDPEIGTFLFAMSQPYVWFLICFFLFLVSQKIENPLASFLLCLLAIFLSTWMIRFFLFVYLIYAFLYFSRQRIPKTLSLLLVILISYLAERYFLNQFRDFYLLHSYPFLRTKPVLDLPNISENFIALWKHVTQNPLRAVLVTLSLLFFPTFSRKQKFLALCGISLLASTVLFDWVRVNTYMSRYYSVAIYFLEISTLLFFAKKIHSFSPKFLFGISCILFVSLFFASPLVSPKPSLYSETNREQDPISEIPFTNCILYGSYWDVYRIAGEKPQKNFLPVPAIGEPNRTVWNLQEMQNRNCLIELVSSKNQAQSQSILKSSKKFYEWEGNLEKTLKGQANLWIQK